MRRPSAVLQRVKSASVTVDGHLISSIGQGILVLAGIGKEDTEKDADSMIGRVLKAKLWPDENDKSVYTTNTLFRNTNQANLTHLSQQPVEEERAGHKWRDPLRYAQPDLTNTNQPKIKKPTY